MDLDYKVKGAMDICEIFISSRKNFKESEEDESSENKRKGYLSKTLIRKIYTIVTSHENPKEAIPDLLYLVARNESKENGGTELWSFVSKVIELINNNTLENVKKYLEGAVMVFYVLEGFSEKGRDIENICNLLKGERSVAKVS
ncbi:hypothetical protein GFS03_04865 [Sulfolobus sp. E5-1-F]|uniref:hypothetical protein n=1 Tax=Saccharolobus sp. E5-1-F TaxID=2663019 RepID=UPI001296F7CC|nr:hypothetical protein [Sulfolobus sp. E5-1-F]QGA53955.1 hypothetical protein GFS03_04865 [Sulfolobus sp. E5-1-F]